MSSATLTEAFGARSNTLAEPEDAPRLDLPTTYMDPFHTLYSCTPYVVRLLDVFHFLFFFFQLVLHWVSRSVAVQPSFALVLSCIRQLIFFYISDSWFYLMGTEFTL